MKQWVLGIVITLATGTSAWAQPGAEAFFSQGMEAFRSGNFEAACDAFAQARREGMAKPALYYNMGVCAYRLGRHEEARNYFLKAADYEQLQQLAYYNLGLVALKEYRRIEAVEWFDSALEGRNDKIRALAAIQMEQLRQRTEKNGYGMIGASLGVDDNVVDPTATTTTDEGDSFSEIFAMGSYLFGSPSDGWRLDGSAYMLNYAAVDELDLAALRLGAGRLVSFGQWRGEAMVFTEHSTLGQEDYLATQSLELKTQRAMGDKARLRLRYRFDRIEALDSGYDYLQGQRHRAEIDGSRDFGGLNLGLAYEYEANDREDLKTATTFSNYSPERHSATVRGELDLSNQWRLAGRLGYRFSEYDEPNLLTGGTTVSRSDEQLLFNLRAEATVHGAWRLFTEYNHTENASNIDAFDYNHNIVSAGVTRAF